MATHQVSFKCHSLQMENVNYYSAVKTCLSVQFKMTLFWSSPKCIYLTFKVRMGTSSFRRNVQGFHCQLLSVILAVTVTYEKTVISCQLCCLLLLSNICYNFFLNV